MPTFTVLSTHEDVGRKLSGSNQESQLSKLTVIQNTTLYEAYTNFRDSVINSYFVPIKMLDYFLATVVFFFFSLRDQYLLYPGPERGIPLVTLEAVAP